MLLNLDFVNYVASLEHTLYDGYALMCMSLHRSQDTVQPKCVCGGGGGITSVIARKKKKNKNSKPSDDPHSSAKLEEKKSVSYVS